jgi:hypothetical protein
MCLENPVRLSPSGVFVWKEIKMEILRGEEAKAHLDTEPFWQGRRMSPESKAAKELEPGEVLLIKDHDISDGHTSITCALYLRIRQQIYRKWGKGEAQLGHGSTITVYRKEIKIDG